jgi:hypothetical protein
MATDDSLIDQANKLMRRRVFVASGAQPPAPPPPEPAPAIEPPAIEIDDLPVLTEVFVPEPEVPPIEVPPPEPVIPQEAIDARAMELVQAQLPFQRQAVADELAAWLDSELPQVVMRVLDGVTDQIIGQVTAEARAALLPRLQDALETDNIALDEDG